MLIVVLPNSSYSCESYDRLPSNSLGLTYIGAYAFQCVRPLKLCPRLVITPDIGLRGNSIRHQYLLNIHVLDLW